MEGCSMKYDPSKRYRVKLTNNMNKRVSYLVKGGRSWFHEATAKTHAKAANTTLPVEYFIEVVAQ